MPHRLILKVTKCQLPPPECFGTVVKNILGGHHAPPCQIGLRGFTVMAKTELIVDKVSANIPSKQITKLDNLHIILTLLAPRRGEGVDFDLTNRFPSVTFAEGMI